MGNQKNSETIEFDGKSRREKRFNYEHGTGDTITVDKYKSLELYLSLINKYDYK